MLVFIIIMDPELSILKPTPQLQISIKSLPELSNNVTGQSKEVTEDRFKVNDGLESIT
jgi:hypothetical protein